MWALRCQYRMCTCVLAGFWRGLTPVLRSMNECELGWTIAHENEWVWMNECWWEWIRFGEHEWVQVRMNKTGTRQYTRAVCSAFAEIHSTHPGSLVGLLEFPVRFCDASHITTHSRPILWLRSHHCLYRICFRSRVYMYYVYGIHVNVVKMLIFSSGAFF